MPDQKNQDDDLPEGLRGYLSENAPVSKKKESPKPVQSASSSEEQAKRDEMAIKILQEELYKARDRIAKGDERARGDITSLEAEIKRKTGELPASSTTEIVPTNQISGDAIDVDSAPGLKTASTVSYATPKTPEVNPMISDKTKAELGLGAIAGAVVGNRQRKTDAKLAQQTVENLPIEMRPVDTTSLQRYINSQLKYSVPLEDLKKLTGVDIRTLKEAQAAIRVIQGSEMQRTPVVKDINGQKTVVSHRITPAQAPIDISMYEPQSSSVFSRIGSQIADKAKSLGSSAISYMRPITGGMVAAPQLMSAGTDYAQKKPIDWSQIASGLGGLGLMTKSNTLGTAGALAQLPYAIKHREELMKNMNLSDLVPDIVKMGMTGSELYEPALPSTPPQNPVSGVK